MKKLLLKSVFAWVFGLVPVAGWGAEVENDTCPIMIEDGVDHEEMAEFEGKKVYFCCSSCVKAWNKNPKYYIKVMPELLPQFKGMEAKLELDKVELMEQKFCPVYPDRVVTPGSPTVDYKGKKIHVYSSSAARRWQTKADEYVKKALAAGALPQLPGNAKVPGKVNVVKKAAGDAPAAAEEGAKKAEGEKKG